MALIPRDRDQILLFNATAHYLWRVLHILGRSRMAGGLRARYGLPEDAARDDAEAIWVTWARLGLLDEAPADTKPGLPEFVGEQRDRVPLGQIRLRLGSIKTRIAYSERYAMVVEPLFASFLTDCPPAGAIEYRLEEGVDGCGSLCEGGRVLARSAEPQDLIGALCISLLEKLSPEAPLCAVMHGGAVASRGKAVVLAGPSGSGKSTLAAYLAARGYRGLCDDLLAIRAHDRAVVPFPIAMKIKPGSVAALRSSYPNLNPDPDGTQTIVLEGQDADPSIATALVFPEYRLNAVLDFGRLDVEDALERLLKDRLFLGSPVERSRLACLVDWLGRVERRRLVYSDLADAERCIRSTLPR